MHPQGLTDTGPEPVRLYQECDQVSHLFQVRAMSKISERFLPRHAGPQLQRQETQFITQFRVSPLDLFTDTPDSLVQSQPCLNADHHQIQCVRNGSLNRILASFDGPAQPECWSIIATSCGQDIIKCEFGRTREA